MGLALELGRWLRLSRSEERSGGRKKAVLLANCVEAIAAAVYLDTGTLHAARSFVEMAIVEPRAGHLYRELRANHTIGDYKSALQEFLQAQGLREPEYLVKAETGPDHRKRFDVEVRTSATETEEGRALASGNGSTKKKAEQEAAERAYRKLVSRDAARGQKRRPGRERARERGARCSPGENVSPGGGCKPPARSCRCIPMRRATRLLPTLPDTIRSLGQHCWCWRSLL